MNLGEQIHASMKKICEDDLAKQEADPTGRSSKDPGAKLDAGKVRMGLVLGGFANALTEVAKVGTNGAAKYSDNGWKQVPNAEARYTDALLRHVFKHMRGEEIDPEWGLPHLAHAAWGCLAVLEKMLERQKAGQILPKGTTFENGFAMVPNENPLRFKLNPESLPPGTTITVTRPIGGSPEQAAPLKEFTPLPTEPTSWESLPALLPGVNYCTIKMYYVDRYVLQSDKSVKFYIRHDNGLTLTFTVKDACELMELGLVSRLANRIWRTYVSDADIAGWVLPMPDEASLLPRGAAGHTMSVAEASDDPLSSWVNVVERMDNSIKRYQVLGADKDPSGVIVTCRDLTTQGARPIVFHVNEKLLAEKSSPGQKLPVDDFICIMKATSLLSDLDIAVFTGFAVMKENGSGYKLKD